MHSYPPKRRWPLILTFLLAVGFTAPVLGADLTPAEEAAIMEKEEKLEAELPLPEKPPGSLSGRIQLQKAFDDNLDTVVGLFVVGNHAYQLRLAQAKLWDQVRKHNGKTVTLFGKVRMRGKYFIADGLQVPSAGVKRGDRGRRAGM
jgi:hypothetical protein